MVSVSHTASHFNVNFKTILQGTEQGWERRGKPLQLFQGNHQSGNRPVI